MLYSTQTSWQLPQSDVVSFRPTDPRATQSIATLMSPWNIDDIDVRGGFSFEIPRFFKKLTLISAEAEFPIVTDSQIYGEVNMVDHHVDANDLRLALQELGEVADWARDEGEVVPNELALDNATLVMKGIFWSSPQRFDVYSLNGDVVIDSEAVGSSFVMVLCKNDGRITTLVNTDGKRLRKDYRPNSMESDFGALISFTCGFLQKVRGRRSENSTCEYSNSHSGERNYWKGYFFLKREEGQAIQAEQVANQSF